MQPITERVRAGVRYKGWRRFFDLARPSESRGPASDEASDGMMSNIDPVALTIMALDRIGPARLRTVFHGVPVTIAAPDEQTAEIFRAALFQMAKQRPTDRLISVELVTDLPAQRPGPAE